MAELNLDAARESEVKITARDRLRSGKSGDSKKSTGSGSRSGSGGSFSAEAEIKGRLARTFDRIAEALEARDDHELAEVIREDADAMGQGIVSLTRAVKQVRTPVLIALAVVEPVLAFGRVFRVLALRYAARRQARAEQWEREQQEQTAVVHPIG